MISVGDFVFDWMGRAGIVLDKASRPDKDKLHDLSDWPLKRMPEDTTWYLVALFSGQVVTSPSLMTESLGKPSPAVLRLAARRSNPACRDRLEGLMPSKSAD